MVAATFRFLYADGVIEAIFTAPEAVHNKLDATTKGKPGDAIRPPRAVGPCMPSEIAVTVPDSAA